jgi:hypothetical protein
MNKIERILDWAKIPEEINVHRELFGKDSIEVVSR